MKRLCVVAVALAMLFTGTTRAVAGPSVAAGARHVIVLTDAGTVWTWGWNGWGQIGDGSFTTRKTPQSISITGVTAVAAGGNSTYVLKTDGTVWAWGENSAG